VRLLSLGVAAVAAGCTSTPDYFPPCVNPYAPCSPGDAGADVDSSGAPASDAEAADSVAADGAMGSARSDSASGSSGSDGASGGVPGGPDGSAARTLVFSPYKDTSINLNWNTNVISTQVSGPATTLASDLTQNRGKAITLAFATGECGSETWAGVAGDVMASANVALLTQAGIGYIISTGGAAGSFTCAADSGMATFIGRWASSGLIGLDFDIEAGQSQSVIDNLVQRIKTAHASHPNLRFSLTVATLANNEGASAARSLGASAPDSLNTYGDQVMAAVERTLGFSGSAATWPSYVTVNPMAMDYGSPSAGVCVVSGGLCEMGQSAIQAAYNLHDKWGVPYANIELTPMIGGNDVSGEQLTLADVDTVASFAIAQGLAGVHYWAYDRDVDCAMGPASPTCNSMGSGYAGHHGYLKRFIVDGL